MYNYFVGIVVTILTLAGIYYIFVLPLLRKLRLRCIRIVNMYMQFFANVRYCWRYRWQDFYGGVLFDLVKEDQYKQNLFDQLETVRKKQYGRKGQQHMFSSDLFSAPSVNGAKRTIPWSNGTWVEISEKDYHKIYRENMMLVERKKNVWSSKQKKMIEQKSREWIPVDSYDETDKSINDLSKDYIKAGIVKVIVNEPV